ncbi:hypothetical protein H4R18_002619 [Coemansia javaensis]|uniref:Autophagy-related protein 17 n=1 Tax=Coemansia javaensis TaxID=2761396 RepID=A0A9W8LJS2_9FUNG|nr:hypothetical protein H4R18_002619 [Coemansia javaensis]
MATLEKLTRLSEPSIEGAQAVRELAKEAEELLAQSRQDHGLICEMHPQLAFLLAENQDQLRLCASLERGLRRHLEELESSAQTKRQQADGLRREMAMVVELLKSREVMEKELRSQQPAAAAAGGGEAGQKHTLYDHIDQEAISTLDVRVREGLDELQAIAQADAARCAAALERIGGIAVPEAEDIRVTWEGVGAIGQLVAESQGAADEIAQDLQSMDRHCDQLRDTIRAVEAEGGVLSMDDYNVLLRDTSEIPGIVAELREVVAGVRRRADEINVRRLQYSAFLDESRRRFEAIAQMAAAGQQYAAAAGASQARYAELAAAADGALKDTWELVAWYRQFHSAYDALIAEVHRRRQQHRELLGAVEDMRARLDAMHRDEVRRRAAFVASDGPYLPSDLCPFIHDPPPRFGVEEAGDAAHFASVQSHETRYTRAADAS